MAIFDLPFSIFVFLLQIRSSVFLALHLRPSDLALEASPAGPNSAKSVGIAAG
jgi:hypothetical protein